MTSARHPARRPVFEVEDWKDLSRCGGRPISDFFPEDRAKADSKAYQAEVDSLRKDCWQCPVRVRCFEYALESEHSRRFGVWAGTTPADRMGFILVKCPCGRTIDPFDLVQGTVFRCQVCRTRVRLEDRGETQEGSADSGA